MAWNRTMSLQIQTQDSEGVEVSNLDIDFRVERTTTLSGQSAEFTIYNAKESTRKEISKKGSTLIFKAGYVDEGIGTIFIGATSDANSNKVRSDWVTQIVGSSIRGENVPLEAVNVSLSYASGTLVSQPLSQLAGSLGLALFGSALAKIVLPNGFVFAGNARAAINALSRVLNPQGIGLFIDNAEIIIYNDGTVQSGQFGSSLLNYDSGLLSVEDITQADDDRRRVSFKSILIPTLKPNGLVTFQTPRVRGTFIIDKLVFSGDNHGGNFGIDGEAASQ